MMLSASSLALLGSMLKVQHLTNVEMTEVGDVLRIWQPFLLLLCLAFLLMLRGPLARRLSVFRRSTV